MCNQITFLSCYIYEFYNIYWRSTHCTSSMSVCSDKTDEEIPFDPPIVSKFGPISRSCKTKYKSTDPVQATANQVISRSLSPPLAGYGQPGNLSLSLPLFFSLMFFAAWCTCMLTKQGFLIKWIFSEAIKINEHSPILSNVTLMFNNSYVQ